MSSEIKSVHFIGICGTAMAATAVAMHERGFRVTGSDQNVYPPMSTFLDEHGIGLKAGYAEANLAHHPDLIVVGNAISRGNPEAEYVLEKKLRYYSLPETLKEFFIRGKRSLVVSGTHGKTTTTTLLAWVFARQGLNPSYMIGGLPANLKQGAHFADSEWFIIEGDEYDTAFFDKRSKFVHYLPEVAIINNLEFDHADIFDNLAAIQTSFKRFINLIPRNGLLLANGDDANLAPLLDIRHAPVKRFGLGQNNDVRAADIRYFPEGTEFSVDATRFHLPLVGEFNVRNALAVIACARHCGLTDGQIQAGLDAFLGVKRRLEVRGTAGGRTVVDDFGHHPTALRETLLALRQKYPGRRVWAVFEPRSNTTRRRVFQHELAESLALADGIVVAEVARLDQIAPHERLDPRLLMADLQKTGKTARYLPTVPDIVAFLADATRPEDVICIFSNGGFGGIHDLLLQRLAATAAI